jgi:DNA-binding response OmpR family regulator
VKALVASEDPRSRSWVAFALGPDWEIVEAQDGLEARRLAETEKPDVMISDETMERYGGFGLTREAKALPDPPAAIVILERSQDVWLAKWSNADRWFVRPVDPFDLGAAAHNLAKARISANASIRGGNS